MSERSDIQETLARHRGFLLHTVEGLTDEQAAQRTTVSELTLGGLIKHVAFVEDGWAKFAQGEPQSNDYAQWEDNFRMLPGETLDGLVKEYDRVAAATAELVETLDLDQRHPLPEAPWYEPGASYSVRRVFLHIIAETSQHAGHADIIREALDGQKTMG